MILTNFCLVLSLIMLIMYFCFYEIFEKIQLKTDITRLILFLMLFSSIYFINEYFKFIKYFIF